MTWESERGRFFFALVPLAVFEIEFFLIDSQKKNWLKKMVLLN